MKSSHNKKNKNKNNLMEKELLLLNKKTIRNNEKEIYSFENINSKNKIKKFDSKNEENEKSIEIEYQHDEYKHSLIDGKEILYITEFNTNTN